MIRNLRFFRIDRDWPDDEAALSQILARAAFSPCSAYSRRSLGFEPPVSGAGDGLARRLAGADFMQLRLQSRVLPSAVVREALEERIEAFARRTGRDPGRKEKRELRDEVDADLLPRALLKSDRLRTFFLVDEKILAVATSSAKLAEEALDVLRQAFDSLPAVPLAYRRAPVTLMNQVFMGESPKGFALGRDCRMKDLSEPKSKVSWLDMDLADNSVRKHVKDGLALDQLGMSYDGLLRFSLDEALVLRKLRFEGLDELDEMDDEDPLVRKDAEFTLEAGLIRRLLTALDKALGGHVR